MITFKLEEYTPCLKDVETGDLYDTEVARVKRKSFLAHFNRKSGWYVNWSNFSSDTEVYALLLKGTTSIQGLVAIQGDDEADAVHVLWGCTAPQNNIWQYGKQKYSGVGGHLLAVASDLSVKKGYEGFIYGEAMDAELYEYYINEFGALPLPSINSPYRFMISDKTTARMREVYNYEWTEVIL